MIIPWYLEIRGHTWDIFERYLNSEIFEDVYEVQRFTNFLSKCGVATIPSWALEINHSRSWCLNT